jgi:uncharacterized damage-inducible protein DinB
MLKEYLLNLYDFSCWGRDQIFGQAAKLTAEQFDQQTRFPIHTVKETLVHTMSAEQIYRQRLMGQPRTEVEKETFADLAAIRDYWKAEEAGMRDYLASVSDEKWLEKFRYTTSRGDEFERVRVHMVTQLFFHSAQHRSELAQMVTEFGFSPGDIDFTIYLGTKK